MPVGIKLPEYPCALKRHTYKGYGFTTPRSTSANHQRRGKIYFEFEKMIAKGKLRGNYEQKAILMDEYMDARESSG